MDRQFQISGRLVGPGQPPYVIAEMSGNHNGEFGRALALLEAAKKAGVDAVKMQSYMPDTITIDHDGPGFRIEGGLWDGRTLYELYSEAHTPWDWHKPLFEKAHDLDLTIFSSPFDASAVDLLESLKAPAYKIASFECVDIPLIERVSSTGKPVIISTGMATKEEIARAVSTARGAGCSDLALLHCVSAYPAPVAESNVNTIPDLARTFDAVVGLSDHSLGTAVATAAVALGASIIEKHFTLDRRDGGPDSAFSLEPAELASLVADSRAAWSALGEPNYAQTSSEQGYAVFRRSLYAVRDIAAGERLTESNIRSIRPGHGLAPEHYSTVMGSIASKSIARGEPLDWSMIQRSSA